jgi:hypothetical protein
MKNYMCTHEFKSIALRDKYFEAFQHFEGQEASSVKDGKAHFLMNFNNGTKSMKMFCWWKAIDDSSIIEKLGKMNVFFETECFEMDNIFDARVK